MYRNFFSIVALMLAFTLAFPLPAEGRKRKSNRGRGMAEYMAIEPDAMVEPARCERKPIHASACFLSSAHINNKYREGIDVSHYQGHIDWDAVVQHTEISYAYLKATEGASLVDDTYSRNLEEARRVGLSVGSYHFYRPNIDWKKQFNNLTSVVKAEEQDLVPIIDIEHRGSVSSEKFIGDLKNFIAKVTEHYGKKPLLYTYHNFYNRYLVGEFSDFHFMIARYRSDCPTLSDGKDYIMWQYTATGSINGIRGDVDRSRIMGNFSLGEVKM